ncbi:hypothetical protein DOS84_18065 [Flavobacterium aquariorum]|uniref:Uncharacterized protein n=1 Tax=Flavobacterium aquariorum TaxID=2217670 RepID=A0A2W7TTF4_9FLAO|nr:hypothetical protein [Flavobacterium aquariorum]PZX92000.1 hypothetical protein DOS84_18065 [Flavobacterium aquariorum]
MRDRNGISRFRKTRLFAVVFVNREYSVEPDLVAKIGVMKTTVVQRGHAQTETYQSLATLSQESVIY